MNNEFTANLLYYGFKQSEYDHCLFIKAVGGRFLALVVYVDDVFITGSKLEDIVAFKSHLDAAFTIKDMGLVTYFLGVELSRSEHGTYMSQSK